jgi:hypothetical protein
VFDGPIGQPSALMAEDGGWRVSACVQSTTEEETGDPTDIRQPFLVPPVFPVSCIFYLFVSLDNHLLFN